MQRPTLTVIASTIFASGATLLLALAPALGTPSYTPSAPQEALRVVELPRVVISAAREARPPRVVELPRVVVEVRRPSHMAGANGGPQPVMQRLGN
jgi:hypothetical protein